MSIFSVVLFISYILNNTFLVILFYLRNGENVSKTEAKRQEGNWLNRIPTIKNSCAQVHNFYPPWLIKIFTELNDGRHASMN